MNSFRLKSNEMMFFIDFNNTLVDYENEYDMLRPNIDRAGYVNPYRARVRFAKALVDFENATGITPVICIVTNARDGVMDNNGFQGIHNDLFMTFFHDDDTEIARRNECKKYFKYLIYRENDHFYKLHTNAQNVSSFYERIDFQEPELCIRYIDQFRKKESVDRMMGVVDPKKDTSKFILFAGDSIKDDYPMKEICTPEGVSKIYIRPGKVHKMTYSMKREFCEAKGIVFKSINPKNNKKIICMDETSYKLLSQEEQRLIDDYNSGDYVFLTQKNSVGLIEGIYHAAEVISSLNPQEKQMF